MRVIGCRQSETKNTLTKRESKIRTQFLPKLNGRVSPEDIERSVLELPARLGGLNTINPETDAAQSFKDYERLCKPVAENLLSSNNDLAGVAIRQK